MGDRALKRTTEQHIELILSRGGGGVVMKDNINDGEMGCDRHIMDNHMGVLPN